MKPRTPPRKSYEQLEAELAQALRTLEQLGLEASFQWMQGNPAPLEALNKAEAEDYHVSPNQLKLF